MIGLHFKPRLTQLLQTLRLDVTYERGQGNFLYFRDTSGHEVEVLDLIGGYGSLLLGHSHPLLMAEAQRFLNSGRPIHAQGSIHEFAGLLARELSCRAQGDYVVVFANSGAEAVEAAMKHAILETGSRTFLALERAFHGKTLGAIQLTASTQFREGFDLADLSVVRVPPNSIEKLEEAFERADNVAGFIFEPIQGEGGVQPLHPAFVQRAAELCAQRGVPLIADECQTGMGRTGSFLASEALGVRPDYILLSKALGGGFAKISALLIDRERYLNEFDLKHTSTYAGDDYSCAIALKTLEIIDDDLLAKCQERGEHLFSGLLRLKESYPDVIADVRGAGLMIGIEFRRIEHSTSFTLRFLSSQEDLLFILAGYLFNVHRIRIAPTLSDRFTLRVQPSVLIRDEDIARFLKAMEDVCGRLRSGDALGLTTFFLDGHRTLRSVPTAARSDNKFFAYDEARVRQIDQHSSPVRVAWLFHLIDADDLISLEPRFCAMPFDKREEYLDHFSTLTSPIVMSAVDIRSRTDNNVRLYPILLPFTSSWVKGLIDARRLSHPQALVQKGIDIASSLGCSMVSLGQYTSIVTLNGTKLSHHGMGITTGNSYAIALALQAIKRAHDECGSDPEDSILVVAGSNGNIGRTCAEILAPQYRRTILVGSDKPGSSLRLQKLAKRIPNAEITTDLSAVRAGDVVVSTLNAVDAPLDPNHFSENAIVCDLSVPASVQSGLSSVRPDLLTIKGGIVQLPFGEDLEIVGFPLPRGQTYGCMAEGIILGFEGLHDCTFTGSLNVNHVRRIGELAERHGFELAGYKKFCVLGSERREELYGIAG